MEWQASWERRASCPASLLTSKDRSGHPHPSVPRKTITSHHSYVDSSIPRSRATGEVSEVQLGRSDINPNMQIYRKTMAAPSFPEAQHPEDLTSGRPSQQTSPQARRRVQALGKRKPGCPHTEPASSRIATIRLLKSHCTQARITKTCWQQAQGSQHSARPGLLLSPCLPPTLGSQELGPCWWPGTSGWLTSTSWFRQMP